LIQQELGSEHVVVKPDAGTHGKNVQLAKNREDLLKILREVKPSTINPTGVLAQEFVQKWFYDLRIVVSKKSGENPYCYPIALARAGFKDFRTNTYLGNMVFGVSLPLQIREKAVKCTEIIGKNYEAWVLALDAMINVGDDKVADDEYVKSELDKLTPYFETVKKIKSEKGKKWDFTEWNKRLERAFHDYVGSEHYENVRKIIEESVARRKNEVLFHEANSCPEFWEQTRLVAGINLAIPLLECAKSIAKSNKN